MLDVFIEKTLTLDIHDSTKQYLHDVMKRGDKMAEVVQIGKCSCLAHLCFHLQDVVKSSCSVPLEELQFDLHVFQRKITNL